MLSSLIKYRLEPEEIEIIKENIRNTDDENNVWYNYSLVKNSKSIHLQFAYDTEEKPEMLHLIIKTDQKFKNSLELIDSFQCRFKNLELEN